MLLYYITDRTQFPGAESERRQRLLKKIAEAARAGIDYVQLREKDLTARELESLSQEASQLIHASSSRTRLLINSRSDIALAADAHGVHLTSRDISPADVRKNWRDAQGSSKAFIAVSCHSEADVIAAERAAADFVVFGPVFGKSDAKKMPAAGIGQLRTICRRQIPVIALGGVTQGNARLCVEAGASGVAGIRLFQEGDVSTIVANLRSLN